MNGWTKWLVATLWGVVVAVILFMGNTVKANDDKNTDEHTAIRQEYQKGDEKVLAKLEKVQDKITKEIKTMRKEYQQGQTTLLVQQTKILTLLGQKDDQ